MSEERTHPLNTARGCLYGTAISLAVWSLAATIGAGIVWLLSNLL